MLFNFALIIIQLLKNNKQITIDYQLLSKMFYCLSSIKKPKKQFNLLHLESNELYILSLGVSLIVDLNTEEVQGKLHLCSRSLVFEPFDIDQPLIKMKYSHNISLKLIKSVNCQKLQALLQIQLPASQLNEGKIEKEIQKLQGQNNQARPQSPLNQDLKNKKKGELVTRLYRQSKLSSNSSKESQNIQSQQNYFKDVLMNAIFIQNDKLFVIHRNPISPYLTEINTDNIIFSIDKTNTKEQIIRFLKFYDGFIRTKDETLYINFIIENSVQQSMKEFAEQKKNQGKQINFIHKAMKITPEGNIHGFWTCVGTSLMFCPIINSIDSNIIEYKLSDVKGFLKYRYLMKHQGIEIWFYNKKRSLLLVFEDNQTQQSIFSYLGEACTKVQQYGYNQEQITQLWINNSISNFEYLMYLNTIANRSFNDISSYPIFPWIVSDYKSESIDLDNPEFFRDLSKPIGALNKHRLQKLRDFYTDILLEKYKNAEGYLYPTHYSSPGLVVYFLIRKIPEFVIKLQNGVFGPTDRIFRGIQSTWENTLNLDADFKELIPEFYYSDGDFLVNNEKLELGISQEGDIIDDALIPNWAENVHDFIQKMKLCIESDYVSKNIHHWIDLIFGYKQTGEQAKKSNNLFYPLTYEQNINWNKYQSPYEKAAMEIQVQEFGQCPVQVFKKQHPQRKPKHIYSGPNNLQEQFNLLMKKYQNLKIENETVKQQLVAQDDNQNQKLQTEEIQFLQNQHAVQLLDLQNKIKYLSQQNENLKQFIKGFQEKMDQENSVSSNFLQAIEDQSGQAINENDFDFLNETENSTI
ncbi:hypothetical protein ABPG74_004137 [Tetrahymena malaccensis]